MNLRTDMHQYFRSRPIRGRRTRRSSGLLWGRAPKSGDFGYRFGMTAHRLADGIHIGCRRRGESRSGAALVIALICLLLVGVLAATLARSAVLQHDQVAQEEWQIQAECLAASALERAAARIATDPMYPGEDWLPTSAGSESPIGRVRIDVVADDMRPSARLVRVTADVPDAPHRRARVSRGTTIAPSTESGAASTPN